MTSDRDQPIPAVGLVAVDDPASAAAALGEGSGAAVVPIEDLAAAVTAARVRVAEVVLDRSRTTAPAGSPAVLAAEAHLRRALAGWKLHWWQRDEPVPDLGAWSGRLPAGLPVTLVSVDPDGEVDAAAVASMTAAAPAAVRVVVLQPR
jgi:hypothetical protein